MTGAAISSAREERVKKHKENEHRRQLDEFLQADQLTSLKDIPTKLKSTAIPEGLDIIYHKDHVIFMVLGVEKGQPIISRSLVLVESMSFSMWVDNVEVPANDILRSLGVNKVTGCTELVKILTHLKEHVSGNHVDNYVNMCITILTRLLETVENPKCRGKLEFLIEQLKLFGKKPHQKRYSPSLLAMSVLWENARANLYRQIVSEGVLSLPSPKYIKELSGSLSFGTGLPEGTVNYLRKRLESLCPRERLVALLIDEVYTCQQVEYSNGKFYGYENSEVTKTLLCFMIKGIASRYGDMVAMVPLTKNKFFHHQILVG